MSTPLLFFAQATQPFASRPWWEVVLSNAFGLTLVVIFLAAVIGLLMRLRQRDNCLKLLRSTHVTYLATAGRAVWGNLRVYTQGIELCFEAPHQTPRGIVKTSEFIYESDLAGCLALTRVEQALTPGGRRRRRRQVRRSFNPGLLRRTRRSLVNFVNMIRDALSKALSALVGQLAALRPGNLAAQRTGIEQIGQTLLGGVARAYEPLLERHIGKPVVLRIVNPGDEKKLAFELPGYLVDYTDKFVAVFNVDHRPLEQIRLRVEAAIDHPQFSISLQPGQLTLHCLGPDVLVVQALHTPTGRHDLQLALLRGVRLVLPRPNDQPVELELLRTQRVDIVCPRSVGSVLFGGEIAIPPRQGWHGLAPQLLGDWLSRPPRPPPSPEPLRPQRPTTHGLTAERINGSTD